MPTVSVAKDRARDSASASGETDPPQNPAPPLPEPLEALERVYRELGTSYRELQEQVLGLRAELAVSHRARLKELEEKERLYERLSSLLTVLPGGVLLLDAQQRVVDANPAALRLLGEPLIGEPWADAVARNPELAGSGNAGRRLSVSARPLTCQGEEVVLITDTTEIHELQAQLGRRHRLAAMGEMAARLAHQIRTPLASTTLYLSQLAHDDMSTERRQHIVGRLAERLAHTEGLVSSMLSFVRGRIPERTAITLRAVFDTVEATARPTLRDGVTLSMVPVDDTLRLLGAHDELAGALGNLIQNAAELDRERVHIELWAGAVSCDRMQIRVRDNGPGISEDALPRLFDPFFTTRARGTGLGLAVVAMAVEQHDGELRVCNHAGGGAEFTITLPLLGEDPPPAERSGKHIERENP